MDVHARLRAREWNSWTTDAGVDGESATQTQDRMAGVDAPAQEWSHGRRTCFSFSAWSLQFSLLCRFYGSQKCISSIFNLKFEQPSFSRFDYVIKFFFFYTGQRGGFRSVDPIRTQPVFCSESTWKWHIPLFFLHEPDLNPGYFSPNSKLTHISVIRYSFEILSSSVFITTHLVIESKLQVIRKIFIC